MDLMELCERGATVTSPDGKTELVLDMAFPGHDRIVFVVAGWWRNEWKLGDGLHIVRGPITQTSDTSFSVQWWDGSPVVFGAPEDDGAYVAAQRNRQNREADRDRYMKACVSLRDNIEDTSDPAVPAEFPDAARWVEWLSAHPARTLDEIYRGDNAFKRAVGRVLLRDPENGKKVGVIVFDEVGNVAAMGGDVWFEQMADDYRNRDASERPELAAYANMLADRGATPAGRMPYGPAVVEEEGLVEEIATRMLAAVYP